MRTDPHRPKLLREAIGRKAETRRNMWNGMVEIPAGTVVTIGPSARWDVAIVGEPCAHCGVAVRCHGVSVNDLAFLPE